MYYSESVCCSIRLANNDKLLAGFVYRSPSSSKDINLKLNALLKNAVQFEHSHILICGDFNYTNSILYSDCQIHFSASTKHLINGKLPKQLHYTILLLHIS